MTAETDLLPLPEGDAAWYYIGSTHVYSADEMESYARANVAHATAAKDAEIEALRADVGRANSWNERVSVCRDHVADIVDAPCVICALDAAKARAEQLEDALRELVDLKDNVKHSFPNDYAVRKPLAWDKARTLLRDQEE